MYFFQFAADCARGAAALAQRAADAFIGVNGIGNKTLALMSRAAIILDMLNIFATEILHRGQHRIRRGIAQTAKRGFFNILA